MKRMALSISTAWLVLTVGCSNTADGVKQDSEIAADRTAEAASASADAVGGALETASVKAAIIADERVGAGDINVDTDEPSKTVTLNGSVQTEEQKRIAGEIATTKATGYRIVNNLAVRP
jgi:osmotically-inducible protein OsmY